MQNISQILCKELCLIENENVIFAQKSDKIYKNIFFVQYAHEFWFI